MTLLKAQMNADLLTDDLKRQRASNESFWLVGQPDVAVHQIRKGQHTGKWQVEVRGFDYYNTKSGDVESGGEDKIAVWLLDTDYDGRSLYPRQVFFPLAGAAGRLGAARPQPEGGDRRGPDRSLSRHGVAAIRGERAPTYRRQDN